MIKIIPPDSWDFGEEPVRLIKAGSGSLRGSDLSQFVKMAGHELAHALKNMQRLPGEELAYLIAMGATDGSGVNRNGDGWKSANLARDHETFEKKAKAFRNHCFVGDTPVLMGDRRRIPIKNVKVGDLVVTLNGNKPVTEIMRSFCDDTGIRLGASGLLNDITSTRDHPFLALKRQQVHCPHKYSYLRDKILCKHTNCRRHILDDEPVYIPADELEIDDYLLIPNPTHGQTKVDPNFAELVGWVASEGYIGKTGSIQFTFSEKNTADINSVISCLKANGLFCNSCKTKYKTVSIWASSVVMCDHLSEYIRGIKSHKSLTTSVLDWDEDSLYRLLGAYIDGDGNVCDKNRRKGQLRIRSSSREMIHILTDIIRSVGAHVTANWDGKPGVMVSPTNGKIYGHSGSGVVAVSSVYSPVLCKYSRKFFDRGSTRKPAISTWKSFTMSRIQSKEFVCINEDVYNLEVAGPHHYVAEEVVVHNCNKDKSKSYGIVKKSHYNSAMKRVDLIVGYNATKEAADRNGGLIADEEIDALNKSGGFPTSMSATVSVDFCSSCGNKARNRSEYCDGALCKHGGLKKNIGKVFEDGHHLHADNPNSVFFDISKVHRGADRTAFILGKVASDNSRIISGAELAEIMNISSPMYLWDTPDSGVLSRIKLARDLASVACSADLPSDLDRAFDKRSYQLPESLDKIASVDRHTHLAALAQHKIALPIAEWLCLTTGVELSKCAEAAPAIARLLPGEYTFIQDDNELPELLRKMSLDTRFIPSHIKQWANKYASCGSLNSSDVRRRVWQSSIRGEALPRHYEKSASESTDAEKQIARHYIAYQVNFLHQHEQESDFELLKELASRQNRVAT